MENIEESNDEFKIEAIKDDEELENDDEIEVDDDED